MLNLNLITGELEAETYPKTQNISEYKHFLTPKQSCTVQESKRRLTTLQKPFVPVDKILQNLIGNLNSEFQECLGNFAQASSLIKMKPNTASTTKRPKTNKQFWKRFQNFCKRQFVKENNDLPYLNESEPNSFLSEKINLMPRFNKNSDKVN